MRSLRPVCIFISFALLCACSAGRVSLLPSASGVPATQSDAARGKAKVVLKIPRRKPHGVSPKYLSPATASITIVFTPTTGAPTTFNAGLTPTSTGCTSSLASTVCVLSVSLAPGNYTASFTTYDASNAALSTATSVPIAIAEGQATALDVTLAALPATYALTPYPGSLAAVKPGAIEPVGRTSTFLITAIDRDGNTIVGPGAPAYSVALSGHTGSNPLGLAQPTATAPNVFTMTASSFDGQPQTLTLTATLAAGGTCGGSVACSRAFTVEPQEVVAMDAYAPAGSIVLRAYPDLSLALPSLPASATSQGIAADAAGNFYFFDQSDTLSVSSPPYTGSAETGYLDATAIRIDFDQLEDVLEINDSTGLYLLHAPYQRSSSSAPLAENGILAVNDTLSAILGNDMSGGSVFAGGPPGSLSGVGSFAEDTVYCPTGFGSAGTSDGFVQTYGGAGTGSAAAAWVTPTVAGSPIVAFPGGFYLPFQAYQVACDKSGYTTLYYSGKLNRYPPASNAGTVPSSVAAPQPYVKPYGLTTDAAGNVFFAQPSGLLAWDGSSPTADSVKLPVTPGNIAVAP